MDKEQLTYLCNCVYTLTKLPIKFYSAVTNEIVADFSPDYAFSDNKINDVMREKYLNSIFDDDDESSIGYYVSDDMLGFGLVKDNQSDYRVYIGPCRFSDISKKTVTRMYGDTETERIVDDEEKLFKYLSSLPKILPETMMWLLSFINLSLNHEIYQPVTFLSGSPLFKQDDKVVETIIEKLEFIGSDENGSIVNDYEKELVTIIQSGNIDELKKLWTKSVSLPPYTSSAFHHDMLREWKNKFIETVTVVSRAAISSGVNPNYAHTLKDTYILKSENTTDVRAFPPVYSSMLNAFTNAVHNVKTQNPSDNYMVSRAVSYITAHITEKISATDICTALNISPSYISTMFKREIGMSIPEYITRQKINLAKNLLINTNKSLTEISNYLSFSSQSYFQSQFKKLEGMTPTEYKAQAIKKR